MAEQLADFDQHPLIGVLETLTDAQLDGLSFGVIGFDGDGVITRYNALESRLTGLHPDRVIGQHLFTQIAQCMNNYLVAQRFDDATIGAAPLDETIDFMLTWRMRPTPVRLRMLYTPSVVTRYVLLQRLNG